MDTREFSDDFLDDIAFIRALARKILMKISLGLDSAEGMKAPNGESGGRVSPVTAVVTLSRLLLKLGEVEQRLPKDVGVEKRELPVLAELDKVLFDDFMGKLRRAGPLLV